MLGVTVIIATRNRHEDLEKCLASLGIQTQKPLRTLIMDQSDEQPRAAVAEVAKKHSAEFYPLPPPNSSAGSRNAGIGKASGDLILFLDDDVVLERDYLANLSAFFESSPQAVAATGLITNLYDSRKMLRAIYKLIRTLFLLDTWHMEGGRITYAFETSSRVSAPKDPVRIQLLSGANMCFRASLLAKERFDTKLKKYSFKEDVDISFRAGKHGAIWMLPQCRLVHNESEEGRMPNAEAGRMREVYSYYLFCKNRKPGLIGKLLYAYSRTGRLLERACVKLLLIIAPASFRATLMRINYMKFLLAPDYFKTLLYVKGNSKKIQTGETEDFLP
jgi:glucosyl-dolichyl phosphate glucuronosyltransferase